MLVYFSFLHFQQQLVLLWVIQVNAYVILDSIRMYLLRCVFQWQQLTQHLIQ